MSFDRFKIIGDPYFVTTKYTEKYYRDSVFYYVGSDSFPMLDRAYEIINKEALQTLDSIIDYSQYDNWTFGSYTHNQSPDGNVDLIIMYYRWAIWPPRTTGVAILGYGSNLILDGKIIKFGFPGSGITNSGGAYGHSRYSVKHEIGHLLLGLGHPTYSNTNDNSGFWGIMMRFAICANAYERERLGWINFIDVSQNQTSTIPDYITTGVAYRILIPGKDEAFIIENHQKLSIFDDPNNWRSGKGLFIYHIKGLDVSHTQYDLEVAEGKYNWSNPRWIPCPWCHDPKPQLPVFKKGIANPSGYDGRDNLPATDGQFWPSWFFDIDGRTVHVDRYMVDEKDPYNIGYNQVFSPWSNPNSHRWNNITMTNIAIEIIGKSTGINGEDIFNVKFFVNITSYGHLT